MPAATCTFDVFSSLDGLGSDNSRGAWGGYPLDWPDATLLGGDAVEAGPPRMSEH